MKRENENIHKTFNRLVRGASASWHVYAGEDAEHVAEDNDVSESWEKNRNALQNGQEWMNEILSEKPPTTSDELKAQLRRLTNTQLRSLLDGLANDTERRAWLLDTIRAARKVDGCEMDEAEFARFSQSSLEEMEVAFVDLTMAWTVKKVLPMFQKQCEQQSQQEKQPGMKVDNAGAMAAAVYMNDPAARKMPEAVGACAEMLEQCQAEDCVNLVDKVVYGLLIAAMIVAILALTTLVSSVIATVVCAAMEGTFAGLGTAIIADISLGSEVLIGMVVLALGSLCLAGLIEGLRKLSNLLDEETFPTSSTTPRYIYI